jgi:CrcB protein
LRTPGRDVSPRRVVVRPDVVAVVAAGGSLGSLARWGVAEALPTGQDGFPWATFTENVTGACLLGLLMVLAIDALPPSRYLRPFLGVGVLGGYTTFSTYMLDTRELVADGHAPLAAAYLLGTLVVGLAAVWAGAATARATIDHARRRRWS